MPVKEARRILVFNKMKRYVGLYQSIFATAKSLGVHPSSIRAACTGMSIVCKDQYFRYLQDDIQVTHDDLGVMTLQEYDQLCEVDRKTYPDKKLSRKGMKYTKVPPPPNPNYPFKNKQP